MDQRPRRETSIIVATILGLHLAMIWLLIVQSKHVPPVPVAEALELISIPPARVPLVLLPPMATAPTDSIRRDTHPHALPLPLPARPAPALSGVAGAAAFSAADDTAHPPIDWNSEMSRSAREALAGESAPQPRDFGFPQRSAASPKAKEFAWDHVATHRVESLPEGGILVHLNDNCVLVMFPLPFVGCGIGKKPANGQLFEHMHDPPTPPSEAAAP